MIALIHIGKTGGTTLNALLSSNINKYIEYHVTRNYQLNEQHIVWIRNPIARFCSAFNHSYYGVHTHIHDIKEFNLEHCLIPMRMKASINKPYVFSQEYDALMKQFTSANHLAESLTSPDKTIQQKAVELMMHHEEHLYKGIHWYLNATHLNIKFVGRTEFMKEDILKLSKMLNVKLDENLKLRENVYVDSSMKYLSPLAIQNIIDWYKEDYDALKKLAENGWIDESTLNMYYTYE